MKKVVATAAATACTIAWSLLSALHVPEVAPVVFVAMSPSHVEAQAVETPAPATTTPEPRQTSQEPAGATKAADMAPSTVKALIKRYAAKYGVNPGVMEFTVSCETAGTFDPTIQSGARYTADHPEWGVKKGDRELSFGLAQIHLPANEGITRAQAIDPDSALDFMAKHMSDGGYWRWSCLK